MLSDLINNRTLVLEGSQKARASLVVQMVKNLPAIQETWVQSLGWEDQPTPVSLPGKSPWIEEPGGLQSMVSKRVGHK